MKADIINEFELITKFPLQSYLEKFLLFTDIYMVKITSYYDGKVSKPDASSFRELSDLIRQAEILNDTLLYNSSNFTTYDYWDLVDEIDEIKTKLYTIDNYSRWSRSSITLNNFNPNIEVEHVLGQNETLEKVARDVGYWDSENDWTQIALRNKLEEEDYTPDGGSTLSLSFKNSLNFKVLSVIDNLTGKSLLGKDVYKKFTIEDNDLRVLDYDSTLAQTVDILVNLRQGDNPEFPSDGIQEDLVAGTNLGSIAFPSLFRQLHQTFSKDDCFKSLAISGIRQEKDGIYLTCIVETKLVDNIFKQELVI